MKTALGKEPCLLIFDAFMISNRNIVCFSTPPWEAEYASTTVQLMRELAKYNNVLFVNNPFTIKDVADGFKKKKSVPVKKVFGLQERLKRIPVGNNREVFVLTPPMVLSIQFLSNGVLHRLLMRWNGWLVRRTVQRYLEKLNMQQDLISLVSFNPAIGLEVGRRLNEKLLLYLCYDEIAAAPHLKKHGVWQEAKFAQMADAMLVTSQGLYERKKALAQRCYIIKNAADFPLFSQGFNPDILQTKTVGFIGAIDRRLDYPLLEQLISSLPDAQFLFIGRIRTPDGAAILRKYKNVTLVNSKPLHQLPEYVKQFSVGIIPFKRSEFIKTVYPLKLNEYLAAGVPVVTTNFSYLDDFKSVISIAETTEDFMDCVLREITTDSLEKKRARQAVAQQNSWEHRAEELAQIITELEQQLKKN